MNKYEIGFYPEFIVRMKIPNLIHYTASLEGGRSRQRISWL